MPPIPERMLKLPVERDGRQSHPLFQLWRSMIRRCHDKKFTGYKNYGGRGISVCQRWRDSFWSFVSDVGVRPSKDHSLDRINNELGYEPQNVQWATRSEQNRNTRFNRLITANGKTQTMQDWVEETGIPKSTIKNRLQRGWTDEQIINTPIQNKARNNSLFPVGGSEIVARLGLNRQTVKSRMLRGWTFEEAITKPVNKGGKNEHKSRLL